VWSWYAHKGGAASDNYYAARTQYLGTVKGKKRYKTVMMHVEIFGSTCDHKNRNGLDNRRTNLRLATQSQQCINQNIRIDNKSGYKGVSFHKATGKWTVQLRFHGKQYYFGLYKSRKKAALKYDLIARKYFGEFAYLNFPME
jgi:hypothetical protein